MSQFGTLTINDVVYDLDELDLDQVEKIEDEYGKLKGTSELAAHSAVISKPPGERTAAEQAAIALAEEKISGGVPFSLIPFGSAKGMKAFAFVILSASDPDLTMADIGKTKLVAFAEPDEEMPEGPPAIPTADPSESEVGDSGRQASVASIHG